MRTARRDGAVPDADAPARREIGAALGGAALARGALDRLEVCDAFARAMNVRGLQADGFLQTGRVLFQLFYGVDAIDVERRLRHPCDGRCQGRAVPVGGAHPLPRDRLFRVE